MTTDVLSTALATAEMPLIATDPRPQHIDVYTLGSQIDMALSTQTHSSRKVQKLHLLSRSSQLPCHRQMRLLAVLEFYLALCMYLVDHCWLLVVVVVS